MHKGSWDEFGGWPEEDRGNTPAVGAIVWQIICGCAVAVAIVWGMWP